MRPHSDLDFMPQRPPTLLAGRKRLARLAAGLVLTSGLAITTGTQAAPPELLYKALVAEFAIQAGQIPLAAEAYRSLSDLSPDAAVAQRATLLLLASGRSRDALDTALTWLRLEPASDDAQQLVDTLRLRLEFRDDLSRSLTARREAARQSNGLDLFYGKLESLAQQAATPATGLAVFEEISRPDAARFDVRYSRALLLDSVGRRDEMIRILRELVAERPDDPQSLNALGYALADSGQSLDEALDLIVKANAAAPGMAHIEDSMGWVLFRLGRHEEAIGWLRKAHSQSPDAEISAHLGEALWAAGQKDAALSIWQRAVLEDPINPVLQDTVRRHGLGASLEQFQSLHGGQPRQR